MVFKSTELVGVTFWENKGWKIRSWPPRCLQSAPKFFQETYDTSNIFTWCFAGFDCLRSSFYPEGHRTPQAINALCGSFLYESWIEFCLGGGWFESLAYYLTKQYKPIQLLKSHDQALCSWMKTSRWRLRMLQRWCRHVRMCRSTCQLHLGLIRTFSFSAAEVEFVLGTSWHLLAF